MRKKNTSDRLKEIMSEKRLRQIDILNKAIPFCRKYNIKLGRNDLSQYISGKVEPSQKKLTVLAEALDVNEAWLMGFDVDMDREWLPYDNPADEETFIIYEGTNDDQIIKKYQEVKNKLTDDDKETILFILNKRSNDKNI